MPGESLPCASSFRDLQEWEIIPRRFDPIRSFVTPKSVLAKIGPNPRIIADDVWAKFVWAGLNLTAEDLPKRVHFSPETPAEQLSRRTLQGACRHVVVRGSAKQ